MQIYIIIYVIALCLTLFKKETKFSLALLALLFIVTAFRDETVGADTYNYLYFFSHETGSNVDVSSRVLEFLNMGAYSFIYINGLENRFILIFYAFVSYLFLYIISKKYRIRLSYLLLFFFLTSLFIKNLNISRQVVSITILATGVSYIFDKSFKKSLLFFVFVVLAGGFHASSYFFIFLYAFRYLRNYNDTGKTIPLYVFLISMAFIIGIIPLEPIIRQIMPVEYQLYSKALSHTYSGSIVGLFFILFNLIVQCVLLSRYKGDYYLLFAFCIIISSITVGMDFVVGRITLIFSLMSCVVFSDFFGEYKKASFDLLLFIFVVLSKTYFSFSAILRDPDLVPYNFDFSLVLK